MARRMLNLATCFKRLLFRALYLGSCFLHSASYAGTSGLILSQKEPYFSGPGIVRVDQSFYLLQPAHQPARSPASSVALDFCKSDLSRPLTQFHKERGNNIEVDYAWRPHLRRMSRRIRQSTYMPVRSHSILLATPVEYQGWYLGPDD